MTLWYPIHTQESRGALLGLPCLVRPSLLGHSIALVAVQGEEDKSRKEDKAGKKTGRSDGVVQVVATAVVRACLRVGPLW
jgi:hypothetical protein